MRNVLLFCVGVGLLSNGWVYCGLVCLWCAMTMTADA